MDPLESNEGEPAAEAVDTSADVVDVSGEAGEHEEHAESVLSTFKLEDVPEEYRDHVSLYVKQANGDYTRKTQALASERKELAALQEQAALIAALDADETREDALSKLLSKYGYSFAEDEETAETESLDQDEDDVFHDPRVDTLLAAQAAREEAEAQAQEQAENEGYRTQVMAHAEAELSKWAKTNKVELDDDTRMVVFSTAANLPLGEDGMPDVAGAIARIEARDAARIQAYLQSKKPSSDPPDLSGLTGQPTFDHRDKKARLAHANAVAEAAIARHA